MKIYLLFVFCSSLNFYTTESAKVKISIYYEALCLDSTKFFANQLYPNYSKLKDYIELEFIPYGKAIHNFVNSKWYFECQHGPRECLANKYQACALDQGSGQDTNFAFLYCVMRERNPADLRKMEACAKRGRMDWGKISACAKGAKGDQLLALHGEKTNELKHNIAFVPTVVFDDQFDDILQELAIVDFASVVCSRIKGDKPQFCTGKKLPEPRNLYDYFFG